MNTEKIISEFREKVNEVRRDSHWGFDTDGPTREFGHKTQREMDGMTELFTVTDFGNIEKFILKHVAEAYQKGKEDERDRIIHIMRTNKEPFMVRGTEQRFIYEISKQSDSLTSVLEQEK